MKFLTRKLITHENLNPRGYLHGGELLKWIDEEAAIYAMCQLNNRRVTIPSFSVSTKDIICVRQKSLQHPVVLETTEKAPKEVPDYIEFDKQKIVGRLIRVPKLSDVPYPVQMEPNLVVEFYSR